jgi:hypothetical protein
MKVLTKSGNRLTVLLAKDEVDAYFERYHPHGYDTFIMSENKEGVVVSRLRFCD